MVSLYATVGSNRLDEAKAFYDALMGQAGIPPFMEHPSGGRVYGTESGFRFGVLGPYDGQPATAGNGAMVAFLSLDTLRDASVLDNDRVLTPTPSSVMSVILDAQETHSQKFSTRR